MKVFRFLAAVILQPAARYPADPRAVFVLALSVFSGLTAIVLEAAPETLESQIPRWGVVTWGALLTVGSAVTLFGMARQTIGGVITEQVGSVVVAATTIYYSLIAIAVLGTDAIQVIGFVFAWGGACALRAVQLQRLLLSASTEGEAIRHERDDP